MDGPAFDGFMSYSHAGDELLAPRLQSGLQRFAKPWWRRRAVRIFRDDASLTANPHLWASITDALDDSGWFILLLSPDAAASSWVNREVEYWLEHKDPARIIPVLTEGDLGWVDGNLTGDVPPALHDVFSDEPRWVDLRFARTEEQLDLSNSSFRAAVADIAAPLRGVAKDELESEEVRQNRRTIHTAWAAGIGLVVLAIAAGSLAVYSASQRAIAQDNEAQAIAFASQLVDYVTQRDVTAAPTSEDVIPDLGPASHRYRPDPPVDARLDFLQESCHEGPCTRDAAFVDPELGLRTGVWHAFEPFHIRHGFPATGPAEEVGPPGVTLRVYVRRTDGPELAPGVFPLGQWFRYMPDYVVREASDRCGPGYQHQTEPVDCDSYVHDFPDGLPPGRYSFFVEWRAPCQMWVEASVCDQPSNIISLFDSQVDSPFLHETYEEPPEYTWPHDLWAEAEPIP